MKIRLHIALPWIEAPWLASREMVEASVACLSN